MCSDSRSAIFVGSDAHCDYDSTGHCSRIQRPKIILFGVSFVVVIRRQSSGTVSERDIVRSIPEKLLSDDVRIGRQFT